MLKDVSDSGRVDELAEKMYYSALCNPCVDYLDWDSISLWIEVQCEEVLVESESILSRAKVYHDDVSCFREAILACRE